MTTDVLVKTRTYAKKICHCDGLRAGKQSRELCVSGSGTLPLSANVMMDLRSFCVSPEDIIFLFKEIFIQRKWGAGNEE